MKKEKGKKLKPADKKEVDAKEVPAAVSRIPTAELADLVKEANEALAPVLMAMIAEYIKMPAELMQWATYSPEIFAACKTSLSQHLPSLQLQVTVGAQHTLMLTPTGEVYASGRNEHGQLGVGDNKDRPIFTPVPLPPRVHVKQAAAGTNHSVLLTTEDRVFVFGDNGNGQLGMGDNTHRTIPTLVPLTLSSGERMLQIAAGSHHTLLLTNQRVLACGNDVSGQLGVEDNDHHNVPTPVSLTLLPGERVVQIAASCHHTLLLTTHRMLACGNNVSGRLGVGDDDSRHVLTLVPVPLLPEERMIQMAAGYTHTLLLTTQRVLACGNNSLGQLGMGGDKTQRNVLTSVPLSLLPEEHVTQIAADDFHTLVLTTQGRVLACGQNGFGQLGVGDNDDHYSLKPVPLSLLLGERVTQIEAGFCDSLLLTSTSQLLACGRNGYGKFGTGKVGTTDLFFTRVTQTPWQTSMQQTDRFVTRLRTLVNTALQSKNPKLDLSHYFLGEWDPLPLLPQIRALSPIVKEVNLTHNRLHRWSVATLIQVLQAFPSTVKRIILSNNDLQQYALPLQPCLLELKGQGITVICDELEPKETAQTTATDSVPDLKLGSDDASASSSSSSSSLLSASSASAPSSTPSTTASSSSPFTTETLSTPPTPAPSTTLSAPATLSTPSAIAEPPSAAPQPTGTRVADTSGLFAAIPPIKQIIDDLQNLFAMPEETVAQLLDSKTMAKKKPTATRQTGTLPAEKKPINKNYRHWLTIHAKQTGHVPHACLAQLMTANLLIYKVRRNNPPKNSLAYTPPDLFSSNLVDCFDIYSKVCQIASDIKDEGRYEVLANLQQLGSNLQAILPLMPDNVLQDIALQKDQFDRLFNAVNAGIQSDTTLKQGVEKETPCIAIFKAPATEDARLVM